MTRSEVIHIMKFLSAYWPNFRLPSTGPDMDDFLDAWMRLLGDLEHGPVFAAAEAYGSEGKEFAPNPGMLRRRAIEMTDTSGIPSADDAWGEVVEAFARVGSYRTPTFSHPAIDAVVHSMGWKTLCLSEDQMADRAHFMRFYAEARERARFIRTATPAVRELIERVQSQPSLSDGIRHVLDQPDAGGARGGVDPGGPAR